MDTHDGFSENFSEEARREFQAAKMATAYISVFTDVFGQTG